MILNILFSVLRAVWFAPGVLRAAHKSRGQLDRRLRFGSKGRLQILVKLPLETIRVDHYSLGPIHVTESPHFRFAIEEANSSRAYRGYMRAQYHLTDDQNDEAIDHFRYLIQAFESGKKLHAIEVTFVRSGYFLVSDGLHRLAIRAANDVRSPIDCWLDLASVTDESVEERVLNRLSHDQSTIGESRLKFITTLREKESE